MEKLDKSKFVHVTEAEKGVEAIRPSLTYWADAWRRLKKNKLAMAGLIGIILIVLFGVVGPYFSSVTYSDQTLDFKNMEPRIQIYEIADNVFVHLTNDYNLISVEKDGTVIAHLKEFEPEVIVEEGAEEEVSSGFTVESPSSQKQAKLDAADFSKFYYYGDNVIELDFAAAIDANEGLYDFEYIFTYNGKETSQPYKTVMNKRYPFGTDGLGRDLLIRVMYGARISLLVALTATLVNFIIGVIYGAVSGYEGGRVDSIMMRIVDVINSVPLVLYVILLMVMVKSQGGLVTIIIAIGTVYWVGMARLVRGQMLSLKEQEFILAARAIGVSKWKIITRHLIPNAMGPIIVSMTMMIPSAIFTESFLSFIGLGVSAPMASWGTLANNALQGILTYPYQLFFPAMAIAITMLAFNFLGDGLRDALDPRLRKG